MIDYLIEILTPYWNYYYLIIAISFLIGCWASYEHDSGIPILWVSIIAIIMHWGKEYLQPMIEGIQYFSFTVLGILLSVFSISWAIIMIQSHYNLIVEGTVVR